MVDHIRNNGGSRKSDGYSLPKAERRKKKPINSVQGGKRGRRGGSNTQKETWMEEGKMISFIS